MVVDADLRSITPDWIRYLLEPVLEKNFDYVAPMYSRYKWDGTITNNVAYNLTRALYGKRIRQPIGGDFGLSKNTIRTYLTQNVWMTDVARFGIDIWMTTQAIASGCRVCQANLGVKVHDPKDPGVALGPMFRQVVWTLFTLMEQHDPEVLQKSPQFQSQYETFTLAAPRPRTPVYLPLSNILQRYFSSAIAIADSDIDQLARAASRDMDRVLDLLRDRRER